MSEDIVKGGDDSITAAITIQSYTDRPGVARVYIGNTLLFDGEDLPVQHVTVRIKMPFHIHFTQPVFTAAWKDPNAS